MENLVWLANSCKYILEAEVSPAARPHEALRTRALAAYPARGGVDNNGILDALEQRLGVEVVDMLGLRRKRGQESIPWPGRYLRADRSLSTLRDPVKLHALASVCYENLAELLDPYLEPNVVDPTDRSEPKGYGTRKLDRALLAPDLIEDALRRADGRSSSAAAMLGVSNGRLVTDARRQGVRIALPMSLRKRLGDDVIKQIKEMLDDGVPKVQIERTFGISEFTRELIEADDPEGPERHRLAVIERQRASHRATALKAFRADPAGGRVKLLVTYPAAYDWLHRYERTWLDAHIPVARRTELTERSKVKDWPFIDDNLSRNAIAFHERCLTSDIRPFQITKYRILRGINFTQVFSPAKRKLLPQLAATLDRIVESDADFTERRLRWAMTGYSRTGSALSMNRFRRLAGWTQQRLAKNRDRVVELARIFGVPVDPRSLFAD